ncbi:tetratricopeptide repeat protein, partial [Thiolapillus sp.]
MQELKDRVIAARTQWPSGIEADAFASALKGSLTLTPEEKRQVIEALPDWENRQILQFNKRLREEKSYWEARFLGHSALISVIRRAVVKGHMAKIGDAAGARVAANLLPSKLLSAYADVVRLEADPAFFSLTKLRTLREAVETFGLQYAWHDLGFALYKQDDLDGAINAYRQQLKAKPDHEGAWYNLGVALDKQGDPDGAIDAYRQQIKVKPDHP